jgi:hypothetical protein
VSTRAAIAIPLGFALACSPSPAHPDARPPSVSSDGQGIAGTYEITASAKARELAVQASFAPGPGADLTLDASGRDHVRDVEVEHAGAWAAIAPHDGTWTLPKSETERRVRYRFLLAEAAAANDDVGTARLDGDAVESPPSTWLLRPDGVAPDARFRFHVTSAAGESFVTGVFPAAGARDVYEVRAAAMERLPYSAFGALRVHELESGLVAAILPGTLQHEDEVLDWIRTSARTVAGFYGRRPTEQLLVIVRPRQGGRVGSGMTMGNGGASIAIDVGAEATSAVFGADWVLVHEMTHTALPELAAPYHWLEEGLATYVEPLARAQAGLLPVDRVWSEWVREMPNGLPAAGDGGLDGTRSWGRTYWGGALFCLLADVEIRERTQGSKSLRDALRGILAAGGNIASHWTIERVLEVGDAATAVPVLRETHDRMKDAAVDVDLPAFWKRLGVARKGRGVSFDDAAPLAAIRKAMTAAH